MKSKVIKTPTFQFCVVCDCGYESDWVDNRFEVEDLKKEHDEVHY